MSRAISNDIASSFQSSNPEIVYHDIVRALHSPGNSSDLLEIELLGSSHSLPSGFNALVDGNSIAIPKLKLVQAFVFARNVLFKHLQEFHVEAHEDLNDASAVMLLMDPEQLTAANARKKLIQKDQRRVATELEMVLTRELLFIDSMLTSPLHRHTKSPTLWSHRRWVLEICRSINMPYDIQRDLTSVILIAAERHPRNYYSWSHMRWLLSDSLGKPVALDYTKMLYTTKDWCLRHPADTSGWSFLIFCLCSFEPSDNMVEAQPRPEATSAICREVLRLAISFPWMQESVWMFLRTLVASGEVEEDLRTSFFEGIKALMATQTDHSKSLSILQAAHDWCVSNDRRGSKLMGMRQTDKGTVATDFLNERDRDG